MSLEMAHKVILPPKKNYIPQFLKQRDINSYYPQRCRDARPRIKNRIRDLPLQHAPKKFTNFF
jgi:hypothetical protein